MDETNDQIGNIHFISTVCNNHNNLKIERNLNIMNEFMNIHNTDEKKPASLIVSAIIENKASQIVSSDGIESFLVAYRDLSAPEGKQNGIYSFMQGNLEEISTFAAGIFKSLDGAFTEAGYPGMLIELFKALSSTANTKISDFVNILFSAHSTEEVTDLLNTMPIEAWTTMPYEIFIGLPELVQQAINTKRVEAGVKPLEVA